MAEAIGVKKLESGSKKFCSRISTIPALARNAQLSTITESRNHHNVIKLQMANFVYKKKSKTNHTFQEKKTAPKLPGLNKA
jgi:hypothetical protein